MTDTFLVGENMMNSVHDVRSMKELCGVLSDHMIAFIPVFGIELAR